MRKYHRMALACSLDYLDHIKDLKDRFNTVLDDIGGLQQPPSIHMPWTEEDQKQYNKEWQDIEDVASDIFVSLTNKEPFSMKKFDLINCPTESGDYLLLTRSDAPFGKLVWRTVYFTALRYKEWDDIQKRIPNILEIYQLPKRDDK